MLLLLDTHVILWIVKGQGLLGEKFRKLLSRNEVELLVSAISWWEISILVEKGRIKVNTSAREFVDRVRKNLPCRDIQLDTDIVLTSREKPFAHQDPSDRFIAASAFTHEARLVSADENLLNLNWLQVIDPRV